MLNFKTTLVGLLQIVFTVAIFIIINHEDDSDKYYEKIIGLISLFAAGSFIGAELNNDEDYSLLTYIWILCTTVKQGAEMWLFYFLFNANEFNDWQVLIYLLAYLVDVLALFCGVEEIWKVKRKKKSKSYGSMDTIEEDEETFLLVVVDDEN